MIKTPVLSCQSRCFCFTKLESFVLPLLRYMQRLLFIVCFLITQVSYGQQSLQSFARERQADDSVHRLRAITKSNSSGLPYIKIDSLLEQKWLLVSDGSENFSYRAPLNDGAAKTTGAFALNNDAGSFQINGENIVCGIWDDGLIKDHVEFGNRILSKEGTEFESHATHVTGTILAAGVNPAAKGMANKARAYTYFFDNDISEMSAAMLVDEPILLSNHSYGAITGWSRPNGVWTWYGDPAISTEEDYRHGFYSNRAKNIDALAYLSPYYTIVWAAGNDRFETGNGTYPADCNRGAGYDCIIPDAVGKNIITVGAVQKVANYTSPASVVMSHFSSWGPTDDGRIKPDLVGAGMDIFSTNAAGTNTYSFSTGTSMATPNVTGSLMLLQDLHAKLHAGAYMKASTLKALAIHTAKEAGPKPGPDYQFGWGLLDVKAGADFLMADNGIDKRLIESSLSQGQTYQLAIQPQVNRKITLTLCWTDPEGNPTAPALDPTNRMLVNDLDLRLIDKDGLVTLPWILDPSVPQAQAVQGDNTRDNVEKIEFEVPLNKSYTIVVRHKGQLKNSKQDFSLIISYQNAVSSPKTFYWIGNSGSWQDETNWSLTSGGAPANDLPQVNDIVIIDANSLYAQDTIKLLANASIRQLKWINNRKAYFDFNGKSLQLSAELTIGNENAILAGSGKLVLSASESGVVHFSETQASDVDILFENGNWTVNGNFSARDLTIQSGAHHWVMDKAKLNSVVLSKSISYDVSKVTIELEHGLFCPPELIESKTTGTKIISATKNLVTVNISENIFNGEIIIPDTAQVQLIGSGSVAKLTCIGSLVTQGNVTIDHIEMLPASSWTLASGTETTIKSMFVEASSSLPVSITSAAKASIKFSEHKKLCFDHLIVSNVDAKGIAAVNAGSNSLVTNALKWLAVPCDQVVWADFKTNFACAGGLTFFEDQSEGLPTNWIWTFKRSNGEITTSTTRNPFEFFSDEGLVDVRLEVSNATQQHVFELTLLIGSNPIAPNKILRMADDQLVSLVIADAYQWYLNRTLIDNARERNFSNNNQPGLYEVLITSGSCNRLSEPYLIAALVSEHESAKLYPNPAIDYFKWEGTDTLPFEEASLFSPTGQFLKRINLGRPVFIGDLPEGIYLIRSAGNDGNTILRKLVIARP